MLLILFLLFICAFFGYPLAMLVYGAFRSGQPGIEGSFGPAGFVDAYGDSATWETLWASVMFAVAVQAIGIIGGFVFAWISTRTNTPEESPSPRPWSRSLPFLRYFSPSAGA